MLHLIVWHALIGQHIIACCPATRHLPIFLDQELRGGLIPDPSTMIEKLGESVNSPCVQAERSSAAGCEERLHWGQVLRAI